MKISDMRLPAISDFGFRISDMKNNGQAHWISFSRLRISHAQPTDAEALIPKSEIRNPKSPSKRSRHLNSSVRAPGSAGSHAAFTLVEMLVAVGLVVLMMTLFATIFQMATGAMSTQKGLAENDQRVRLVLTRLRNDLNGNKSDPNDPNRPYRTFRNVVPYGPDETPGTETIGSAGTYPGTASDRKGYFYISENDPNDDTDDVLAFTVQMPSSSSELYAGRAAIVLPDKNGSYGPGNPTPGNSYPPAANQTVYAANPPVLGSGQSYWSNQPEFDDIQGTPNLAGDSQFAEICYFLRRGTLYRRVMLIRQPNLGATQVNDGTPTDNTPAALSMALYSAGGFNGVTRNFWTDFDYSVYFNGRIATPALTFHGTGSTVSTDSLSNSATLANPFVLGNPAYRFGFDCTTNGANPSATYGQPREFITTPNNATPANTTFFIGRFTQAETSDPNFGYPGYAAPNGNPMNLNTALNFNTTTGAVSSFPLGARGGEDVLMTNVLKFDIKVFDPAASVGPDGGNGVAGFNDNGNFDSSGNPIIDDIAELGWPGSDDGDFRDIGHGGATGFYNFNPLGSNGGNVPMSMKFKQAAFPIILSSGLGAVPADDKYAYPNANYNYGNAAANNISSPPFSPFANRYDTWNPLVSMTNTKDTNGKPISECPPFRPFTYGPDGRPGLANIDDDGDGNVDFLPSGLPDLKELGWINTDDQPSPLSAIQIKITFYDRTSKQIREATLVQSLLFTP